MEELKSLGLDRNTIVVFTSDHGETMCSHGTSDPKNSIYEESYNVPFMIRYPGHIRHRVDSLLLSTTDIMPTLLGLSGLGDRIPESVQGHDLSPVLLENGKDCARPEAALYIRNLDGEKGPDGIVQGFFPQARGIRTGKYSMEISIGRDTTVSRVLIFDNIKDPYQMTPISCEDNPELFRTLCGILEEKLMESDDIWYREGIYRISNHTNSDEKAI